MVINDIKHTRTPNCEDRIGKYKPDIITYHITEGGYDGTILWEKNSASGISSHFIVSRTGQITQLVPIHKRAWSNATTESSTKKYYYGRSTNKYVLERRINANDYTISIENEGFYNISGGALTELQLKANIELTQYIREQVNSIYGITIPIDRDHLIGHFEINPKEKPNCPGSKFQWDELINGVKAITNDTSEYKTINVIDNFMIKHKEIPIVTVNINNPLKIISVKHINTFGIGRAIKLANASLYISSTTEFSSKRLNGTYYIYDGKEIDGRYRVTNSKEKVAQAPLEINVLGFIDKSAII